MPEIITHSYPEKSANKKIQSLTDWYDLCLVDCVAYSYLRKQYSYRRVGPASNENFFVEKSIQVIEDFKRMFKDQDSWCDAKYLALNEIFARPGWKSFWPMVLDIAAQASFDAART